MAGMSAKLRSNYKIAAKIKKHRKKSKRQRQGRIAKLAQFIRELDREWTADDLEGWAKELGVTTRTVYHYLKDLETMEVCRCCGRPFAEDKMIAAVEAVEKELGQ